MNEHAAALLSGAVNLKRAINQNPAFNGAVERSGNETHYLLTDAFVGTGQYSCRMGRSESENHKGMLGGEWEEPAM